MSYHEFTTEMKNENEIARLWRALLEVQRRMADLEKIVREARLTQ